MALVNSESLPLVTIIVITYNQEEFIAEAIDSCLGQDYENIEILVVDDGSSDRTQEIILSYKQVKLIEQLNSGGCSSPRNVGINQANGRYICFLDGDDIMCPGKVRRQICLLEENRGCSLVISNYKNFQDGHQYDNHFSSCTSLMRFGRCKDNFTLSAGKALDLLIDENFSIAGSPMFTAEIVRNVGGFDERLTSCEDYHFIYRCVMRSDLVIDSSVQLHRRIHNDNLSSNKIKMLENYYKSRISLSVIENNIERSGRLHNKAIGHLKECIKSALHSFQLFLAVKCIVKLLVSYSSQVFKIAES